MYFLVGLALAVRAPTHAPGPPIQVAWARIPKLASTARAGPVILLADAEAEAAAERAAADRRDAEVAPLPRGGAGAELRVDDDARALGASAFLAVAALVPLLAWAVAVSLGMGGGSADNGGLGVPLTREEVRALDRANREGADAAGEGGAARAPGEVGSLEEAAEEQALVDVLRGGVRRAR